jgi:hypothetical protein
LIYGNDWSLIPYRLSVGSLSQVLGVVVTDVFGVRTLIRPAAHSLDGERDEWGLFHLSIRDEGQDEPLLFLPPTLGKSQQSAPLESVALARDEMSNLVWGIEQVIPRSVSGGMDGFEAAIALVRLLTEQHPPPDVTRIETGAAIEYRLGSQVSENWIPFIPVQIPGSNREIRLQRAAMPRHFSDVPIRVEPRGTILRHGLDETPAQPYFIHEEEVPQSGIVVTRAFQRVRWHNGAIYTWLGRQKQIGREPGASGVVFDQIVPK